MEFRGTLTATLLTLLFTASCRQDPGPKAVQADTVVANPGKTNTREIRTSLKEKGFQIFDYVDETTGDTIIMQQYFMVFLKRGPNRPPISKQEGDSLQALHLAHLGRMYDQGFADISGPFGDDGEIRGITIYNTPTLAIADSLARLDLLVKLGRLRIEVHPWWAAKGFPLR